MELGEVTTIAAADDFFSLAEKHQAETVDLEFVDMLRSRTVWLNCHNVFDPSLPFGGYKQSGWGRENGADVMANYMETKVVTAKL